MRIVTEDTEPLHVCKYIHIHCYTTLSVCHRPGMTISDAVSWSNKAKVEVDGSVTDIATAASLIHSWRPDDWSTENARLYFDNSASNLLTVLGYLNIGNWSSGSWLVSVGSA